MIKNLEKQETLVYVFLIVLEHKCTCSFGQHAIRRGMETDTKPTKYSHFLGLGSTRMLLYKRVIRGIVYLLFE